jgi:NADP-reducing hydrogenase subunit HndB
MAFRSHVLVCAGTGCVSCGSFELGAAIEDQGVTDVIVTTSGCAGLCSREPMATVELRAQAPVKYVNLTPERMQDVFRRHVLGGEVVTESALAAGCETTG